MRGEFLVGAALGGALIAACYSDPFRATCRKALEGIGNQINKQISGLYSEISGEPVKEQTNDNDGQGALALRAE